VALFRRKAPEPASIAPGAPLGQLSKRERSDAAADAAPRAAESQLGTGHGRSETSHARMVGFERATREPAETLVIYYDSYSNLLARGIVPQPPISPVAPCGFPCGRRPGPNPFPGFVADPPA
jgi:hypothetical protein